MYLFGIEPVEYKHSEYRKKLVAKDSWILVVKEYVRQTLDWFAPYEVEKLIVNFTVTHRAPGHKYLKFYQTNLLSAEKVNACSDKMGLTT